MRNRKTHALVIWTLLSCAPAWSAQAPKDADTTVVQWCNGIFSNGVKINPNAAVYMPDVGYAELWFPLAETLPTKAPDAALALLKSFPARFPKSRQMVKHLFLAARICAEQKLDKVTAKNIVDKLKERFSEDPLMPEILNFEKRLQVTLPR